MPFYNAKSIDARRYGLSVIRITKFDNDMNVESSYEVTSQSCECEGFRRHAKCRHREMWELFQLCPQEIDSEHFYDFDRHLWIDSFRFAP